MVYFVDIHDYAHVSISESSVSQINCGIHFDLEFYNIAMTELELRVKLPQLICETESCSLLPGAYEPPW